MMRATIAGAAYFALVMSVGFGLGAVRTLYVAPRLGEVPAVLIELPVILTAAWLLCGWLLRRFAVPPDWRDRLVMGGLGFVLLMAAETAMSYYLFDRPLAEQLQLLTEPAGALGLLGQFIFATFPLFHRSGGGR